MTDPAYPILMYHQIAEPPPRGTPLRGLVVSPGSFARQMQFLRLLGYRGVSLKDLQPYLRGERTGKVLGISFDDGYLNNHSNALPVLDKLGFTATCYAVSALPGGHNDWDAGIGVPRQALMDVGHWRDWLAAGMDIGSHTRNHADLTVLGDAQARAEIAGARTELEDRFAVPVEHFCYPYGRYTRRDRDLVEAAGYATATTTHRGRARPGEDVFLLPRVIVAQATQLWNFWLKISTAYEDRRR
jgi:peptidoglycan/xylan/chitin deacetylase (PgdA/CDA1 family)